MPENSPRTTTPTSCSSRFSARPEVPSSKVTSSLAMTPGRPSRCAMPSAASTTVPTSVAAAPVGSYAAAKSFSASRMTSGLIVSSAIVFLRFRGAAAPEASARAGKSYLSGDLHAQAPDDGAVDDRVEPDLLAVPPGKDGTQALGLGGVEGCRRDDGGDDAAPLVGDDVHRLREERADAALARLLNEG